MSRAAVLDLAARTIGTLRNVKPVGIEAAFDDYLKGVSGKRLMQRISSGDWMPVTDKDEIEPHDGNDVHYDRRQHPGCCGEFLAPPPGTQQG